MIKILSRISHSRRSIIQASRMACSAVAFQTDKERINSKFWVHCPPGEDRMQTTFTIRRPACGNVKTIMMNRRQQEPVSQTLTRLSANIASKFKPNGKKRRKAEEVITESIDVQWPLQVGLKDATGNPVNPDLVNSQAWSQGSIFTVDDIAYEVEVNPPRISNLILPRCIMTDHKIYPYMDVERAEINQCLYNWYRLTSDGKEILISDQPLFTPTQNEVGQKIKLVILPKCGGRVGIPVEATSPGEVTVGPSKYPFEERHKYTANYSSENGLRVVSYNLLAEIYSNSDYSRDTLFEYCPNEHLDYDFRRQLILKELLGYNSDIICLQELDKKHYKYYYQPILEKHGYIGEMLVKRHKRLPKSNTTDNTQEQENDVTKTEGVDVQGKTTLEEVISISEGSAIFYRQDKFRQIDDFSMNIAEVLEMLPLYDDLFKHAELSARVKEKLIYRSGANLQVKVLESVKNPNLKICISTTHLYFLPEAAVIRLFQVAVSLRLLQHVKSVYSSNNVELPVIYCGDYNAVPTEAAAQYVLNGDISAQHNVWSQAEDFTIPGRDLKHNLKLDSACGFPEYTNFTPTFRACLDYIFYDKELLNVDSVVPLPDLETLSAHRGGIPSPVFPSDHLALVCDISWKQKSVGKSAGCASVIT